MGTRGLNGWVLKGKHYAQYNQFDTYVSGLGREMANLAKKITLEGGWDRFKTNAEKMTALTAELDPVKDKAIIERYAKFHDAQVSSGAETETYSLLRHLQGISLMEEIYAGNVEHYRDEMPFIKDSLFCEHAWFFNLDTMKLDCWTGFQKKAPGVKAPWGRKTDNGYYPCKLIMSIPFNAFPEDWEETFEKKATRSEKMTNSKPKKKKKAVA